MILRTTYFFTLRIGYGEGNDRKTFRTGRYVGTSTYYIPANNKCVVYEYKGKAYVQDFPYIKNNTSPNRFEVSIKKYIADGKLRLANIERQLQAMIEPEVNFRNKKKDIDISQKEYSDVNALFKYNNEDIPNLNNEELKIAIAERECIPSKYSNSHILTPALFIKNNEKVAYVFVELEIVSYIPYSYEEMGYYVGLCKYLDKNKDMYFDGQAKAFIEGIKIEVAKSCKHLANEKNYFKLKDVLVSVREISKEEFFSD